MVSYNNDCKYKPNFNTRHEELQNSVSNCQKFQCEYCIDGKCQSPASEKQYLTCYAENGCPFMQNCVVCTQREHCHDLASRTMLNKESLPEDKEQAERLAWENQESEKPKQPSGKNQKFIDGLIPEE